MLDLPPARLGDCSGEDDCWELSAELACERLKQCGLAKQGLGLSQQKLAGPGQLEAAVCTHEQLQIKALLDRAHVRTGS